jgi:PKD repeat protein
LNQKPDYVRLNLRKLTPADAWKNIDMNIAGTSYSSGVSCYINLTLTEGTYTYHFTAKLGTQKVLDPISGEYTLYVSKKSQNTFPFLSGGYVTPQNGSANTTIFTYIVNYDDGKNGTAKVSNVVIDGKSHAMVMSPKITQQGGVNYEYSTNLTEGTHNFYFAFSDGKVNLTLPSSGTFTGPSISGSNTPKNRAPSASIAVSPLTGNTNTTFYFNGTGTDPDRDKLTFSWMFSDGIRYTGKQSVTRKFSSNGNYTATLTVTDTGGLSGTATATVSVGSSGGNQPPQNRAPVIITNLKSFSTVTVKSTLYITAEKSFDPDGDSLTFKWNIISANSISPATYNTSSFNYTFDIAGNYTFEIILSDSKTTSSQRYLIYASVNPPRLNPTAKASVTVNGMTASLSGKDSSDSDGTIVSYSWNIDGKSYSGMYYNHTYTTTGYKTVTLTVKDNDGLTGNAVIGFYIMNRSNDGNNDNRDYNNLQLGIHIKVENIGTAEPKITTYNSESGFKLAVNEFRYNFLKFQVDFESDSGALIILDLVNVIDTSSLNSIQLKMNGKIISSKNIDDIVSASEGGSSYHISTDGDHPQLLLYIDHFSVHTFELEAVSDSSSTPEKNINRNSQLWIVSGVIAAAVMILIIVLFMQVKKKKKMEYYSDFQVAEERVNNGSRVKSTDSENVDWDDFL